MDVLQDEIESLEAILMDDVKIHRSENSETEIPEMIETTIFPEVGDDTNQQYVSVTLQVILSPKYPDESPQFMLLRPRGLDDQRLNEIKTACTKKLKESIGYPVIFDLIELIKEHLTDKNLPSGQCVVCLYGFSEGDEFTKTECFHYLHSYCLSRHLIASRRNYQEEIDKLPAWLQKASDPFQATCPVCREVIKDDSENLKNALPPAALENAPEFQLTNELKELQKKMTKLFLHQKSRGAIIDIDANIGAIISIEPEQHLRQRNPRKNNHRNQLAAATGQRMHNSSSSNAPTTQTRQREENSASSTNIVPLVQPAQQLPTETTTNNNNHYQYNRRHHRGGKRHQNYHHHHQQRLRSENGASSHSTSVQQRNTQEEPTSANVEKSNKSGKQHKQGFCGVNTR